MDAARILPDGLTARPLTVDDVDPTIAMVNACELADSGERMWERADLLADSSTDGFDRARDWVGVFDGDAIVGWGMVVHRRSAWVDVHPDARGRGVGTWLRRWSVERARQLGADRIGQTIDDRRTDVVAMFAAAGYTPRRTSWILRMEHPTRPPDPEPPEGVDLRAFDPGDGDELLMMFEEAFSEFEDRLPSTLTTWRSATIEREGFVPEDLVVAVEGDRIVGGAFLIDSDEIWVDKIAVHRDRRDRGVARALLQTAFQRSFDRGYAWTSLSTDSNTGALTLYERIGMRAYRSFTHHALDL
jgi:GNAT superfamily N-acetyltransferase